MNILRKVAPLLFICSLAFILPSCKSGSDKGAGSGDGIELKLNFKPGDKYMYSTQVNQKVSSFGVNADQTLLMEMIYAYAGEEGANKKLDIIYDHVMIKILSPMGQTTYDSKGTEKKDGSLAFMDSLIGKSFSISIAPNGDITKVEGLGNVIGSIAQNADAGTKEALNSQFSDTAIRLMMQNSFDLYPGKKVKVGEQWGKKTTMSFSGINVNVENTYTLKSVEGDRATVAVLSAMNLPKTDMGSAAGVPMQMEMSGKQEGTMEVEQSTGRIISGKTTQTINGKISAAGQELPMSINGDITINSKKI